nr:polysaccharide biosynthesis C-terminal domain-containing protein [candidate division Zixibacteria bacterium]
MVKTIGIKQAILGVSGIVIISKLLGFLREMVIAERFGTSREYDIYLIAIAAPVFLNMVISRATNFLTVPFLTRQASSNTSDISGRRAIWSAFNSMILVVFLIILLVAILAPYLVSAVGPGLDGEELARAVFFCRIISVMLLLGFLESFLRSALNVKKNFVYPVVGTIVLNITVITIIYIFSGRWSVAAILYGLLIGMVLQIIFLILKAFNFGQLKYFNLNIFGGEIKKVLGVGGILILVELVASTFFLIDRYYASGMIEGVVSALNYSSLLVMLPINIAGFAIASVIFPYLSERADYKSKNDFASLLRTSLGLALTIGLPCGIFYVLFAAELTAAVFFRGAFNAYSLEITSRILATMSPYLVFMFLYTILIQACYAVNQQKKVLLISILAFVLKFVLTGLFKTWFDYPGIGAATSVVSGTTICLLLLVLVRGGNLTGLASMSSLIARILLASLPMVLIALFYNSLPGFYGGMSLVSKFRVIGAGALSFLFYIGIGYLVKIDEIRSALTSLKRRR